jgi:hypothetical protein
MDIWTNHVYRTRGGFTFRVLDIFIDRYDVKTVKFVCADDPIPHGPNGRRPTTGFMPLDVFERAVLEEVAQ